MHIKISVNATILYPAKSLKVKIQIIAKVDKDTEQ